MSRLTKRNKDGSVGISECRYYNYNDFQKLARKLAEYEDLEERGLILKLPCKIGTEVYSAEILYDTIREKIYKTFFVLSEKFNVNMIEDFGKTIFITREEAENKLKEMESAE